MAIVPLKRKAKVVTVGSLIDTMSALRDERRALAEKDKALATQYDELELQLIDMLDAQGTTKSASATASASIGESTQFNTEDWDRFMAYMVKNKLFHLVQRRVSTPAVLELYTAKGVVPGLTPYTKRKINLRNL